MSVNTSRWETRTEIDSLTRRNSLNSTIKHKRKTEREEMAEKEETVHNSHHQMFSLTISETMREVCHSVQ
jgi:hypothetical protein